MQQLLINCSQGLWPITIIVLNLWALYITAKVLINAVVFVVSIFEGIVDASKEDSSK